MLHRFGTDPEYRTWRAMVPRQRGAVRVGEDHVPLLQRFLAGGGDGEAAVLVVRVAPQEPCFEQLVRGASQR